MQRPLPKSTSDHFLAGALSPSASSTSSMSGSPFASPTSHHTRHGSNGWGATAAAVPPSSWDQEDNKYAKRNKQIRAQTWSTWSKRLFYLAVLGALGYGIYTFGIAGGPPAPPVRGTTKSSWVSWIPGMGSNKPNYTTAQSIATTVPVNRRPSSSERMRSASSDATVRVTLIVDDVVEEVYLDGDSSMFGGVPPSALLGRKDWHNVDTVQLGRLVPGKHVLAVKARNRGGAGGMALRVWSDLLGTITATGKAAVKAVTKAPSDQWMSVKFNDKSWSAVSHDGCDADGYGELADSVNAEWVWPNGGCRSKVGTAWFRIVFSVPYRNNGVDDCSPDPCIHGQCHDVGETFHCTCEPRFHGPLCDQTEASCEDGMQNNDEEGVDCGGQHCPSCSKSLSMFLSVDDVVDEAYLDGSDTKFGGPKLLRVHHRQKWDGIDSITLGGLKDGKHVVAIKASNTPNFGPGGLVGRLFYTKSARAVFSTGHDSGSARLVVTTTDPGQGWTGVDFDDSKWDKPGRTDCNAQYGYPEIAAVVGENSRWIWGADGCNDKHTAHWFRFSFEVNRCAPNVCENGECKDMGKGQFSCVCSEGWTGESCAVPAGRPTCQDGIQNGREMGVDCGGGCLPCHRSVGISMSVDDTILEMYIDGSNSRLGGEGLHRLSHQEEGHGIDSLSIGSLPNGQHVVAVRAKNGKHEGGLLARVFYMASGLTLAKTGTETRSIRYTMTAPDSHAWTRIGFDDSKWSMPSSEDCMTAAGHSGLASVVGDGAVWVWGEGGCQAGHDQEIWFRLVFYLNQCAPQTCVHGACRTHRDKSSCVCETGWLGDNCDVRAPPTCSDGIKNGKETGVDCGGGCGRCSTRLSLALTVDDEVLDIAIDGDRALFGGDGLDKLPRKVQWNALDIVNLGVLHEGHHIITIKAKNVPTKGQHPGGLLARLYYAASGNTLYKTGDSTHSHAEMRVSDKEPGEHWQQWDYDDSEWLEVGDGSGCESEDYGKVAKLLGDNAKWVWGPGGCDTTHAHTFYFRLLFVLDPLHEEYCSPNPCQHGGCEPNESGFKCTCHVGWQGELCDKEAPEEH